MDNFAYFDFSFLDTIGSNPFAAMWYIFIHGGFLIFIWLFIWGAIELWLEWRQNLAGAKKQWMVLAIHIPRNTEQTPRAVENIFAHWAGAHGPASWTEKWIDGKTQDTISVEIISIEGHVQYVVRTTRTFRDLIEASIYAQYPDAEIIEIEDYTNKVPHHYPDKEWDIFGTEMIPVKKSDVYPLRTYPEFEDKVSGEFKDPLAVWLENASRLSPGEQAWFQIVLTPIEQGKFRERGEALVKKLTGQKVEVKQSTLDKIATFPIKAIETLFQTIGLFMAPPAAPKKDANPLNSKMLTMTPGERKVVEAIENKMSKIAYMCKVRILYAAKKEIMKKSRVVHPFIGFIKQYNTNDMQALKPEGKKVGMNGTLWWFKDQRNNARKNRFIHSYSSRSNHHGTANFAMNIEELASLWHFPISMQVRAPQLKRTESKRSEPPINLPFG